MALPLALSSPLTRSILESSARCKNAIKSVPIVALRKPKSLRDYLVRAKVDIREPKTLLLGSAKCSSRRCEICKYMDENSHFKSSQDDQRYSVNYNLNCNSSNVVYLITCKKCSPLGHPTTLATWLYIYLAGSRETSTHILQIRIASLLPSRSAMHDHIPLEN